MNPKDLPNRVFAEREWLGWLRLVFGLALFGAIVYFLARNLHTLRFDVSRFAVWWLIAASGTYLVFCATTAAIFHHLLATVDGGQRNIFDSTWVYFVSLQGKYLPGKVGNLVVRFNLLGRRNVGSRGIMSVFLLEQGISTMAGILVIFSGIFLERWIFPDDAGGVRSIRVIVFLGFLMLSCAGSLLLNRFLPAVNRYVRLTSYFVSAWMIQVASISLFFCGMASGGGSTYPHSLEAAWRYCAAILAGFFAVLSPAGLGVREAAFSYFSAGRLGDPDLLLAGVLIRSWITVLELTALAISYAAFRKFGRSPRHGIFDVVSAREETSPDREEGDDS